MQVTEYQIELLS